MPPFVPPGCSKKHSTPGDRFGTFGGIVTALGTGYQMKAKKPHVPQLPNCRIGATKFGGPGYADIGIDKYPEHL